VHNEIVLLEVLQVQMEELLEKMELAAWVLMGDKENKNKLSFKELNLISMSVCIKLDVQGIKNY